MRVTAFFAADTACADKEVREVWFIHLHNNFFFLINCCGIPVTSPFDHNIRWQDQMEKDVDHAFPKVKCTQPVLRFELWSMNPFSISVIIIPTHFSQIHLKETKKHIGCLFYCLKLQPFLLRWSVLNLVLSSFYLAFFSLMFPDDKYF